MLLAAVIEQESGGNPNAVSKCGAKGLMQLMDATGKEWHGKLKIAEPYDPFNPEQNKRIGTGYLKYLITRFKDVKLGLAAYNCGPGRLEHAIGEAAYLKKSSGNAAPICWYDVLPHVPIETQNYVDSIWKRLHGSEAG